MKNGFNPSLQLIGNKVTNAKMLLLLQRTTIINRGLGHGIKQTIWKKEKKRPTRLIFLTFVGPMCEDVPRCYEVFVLLLTTSLTGCVSTRHRSVSTWSRLVPAWHRWSCLVRVSFKRSRLGCVSTRHRSVSTWSRLVPAWHGCILRESSWRYYRQ
jgi:hypothetical protein